jgi:outer membrane biosynthesis protein TonB
VKRGVQLLGALMGALCLHAPLVLIASHSPPAKRHTHERDTPIQLRVVDGMARAVAGAAAAQAQSEQAAPPNHGLHAASAPASAAGVQGADGGPGFDVAPVPERGWQVNLRSFNPWAGAGRGKVVIELEVSAQGEIRRWRLLQSTVPDDMAMAMLSGIQGTAMLPAIRGGEAVDAIARYELGIGPP